MSASGQSGFREPEPLRAPDINKAQDTSIGDIVDAIRSGSMPPWFYTPLHPKASLSAGQKAQLEAGLTRTFKVSPPVAGTGGG